MINTMIRITTTVPTPMYIEYPSFPLVDGLHFVRARWSDADRF